MSTTSQIVSGGGWRGTRTERIRIKAWAALLTAILLACVAQFLIDWLSLYAFIPSGLSLVLATIWFFVEKPRELKWPAGQVGEDPRKLYTGFGVGCEQPTTPSASMTKQPRIDGSKIERT